MPELDETSVACLFAWSCLPNQLLRPRVVALHPSKSSPILPAYRDFAARCGRGKAKLKRGFH